MYSYFSLVIVPSKIHEEEKEAEEKVQAEVLITKSYQLTAQAANAGKSYYCKKLEIRFL